MGVKTEQDYTYGNLDNNQLTNVDWTEGGVASASHSYNYDETGNLTDDSRNSVSNITYTGYNNMPKSIINNHSHPKVLRNQSN